MRWSFFSSSSPPCFLLTRNQKASSKSLPIHIYTVHSLRVNIQHKYIHTSVPCLMQGADVIAPSSSFTCCCFWWWCAVKVTTCSTAANIYSSRRQMRSESLGMEWDGTPQEAKDLSAPTSSQPLLRHPPVSALHLNSYIYTICMHTYIHIAYAGLDVSRRNHVSGGLVVCTHKEYRLSGRVWTLSLKKKKKNLQQQLRLFFFFFFFFFFFWENNTRCCASA